MLKRIVGWVVLVPLCVVLGGVATWFAQAPHRRDERTWRREAERLNREVDAIRRSPTLPIVDDLAKP